MTLRQFAALSGRSQKTIRRWIHKGLLPAEKVPLNGSWVAFRYELNSADLHLAEDIHERNMQKLSRYGPGLERHMRGVGGWRYSTDDRAARDPEERRAGYGDRQPIQPVRCPKCGHVHTPGAW